MNFVKFPRTPFFYRTPLVAASEHFIQHFSIMLDDMLDEMLDEFFMLGRFSLARTIQHSRNISSIHSKILIYEFLLTNSIYNCKLSRQWRLISLSCLSRYLN